jgi:hypothetical protein
MEKFLTLGSQRPLVVPSMDVMGSTYNYAGSGRISLRGNP